MNKRLDSKLQSDAAEFLVLGHLLLENISAFKAYNNQPGYDLVAVSPERNSSARIQVKSRWATDAGSINVSRLDFDFLVFARMNRGPRNAERLDVKLEPPDYYILSRAEVQKFATRNKSRKIMWNKDNRGKLQSHLSKWAKIADFLKKKQKIHGGSANA